MNGRRVSDQHEDPGPDHRPHPEHIRVHDAEAALERNRYFDLSPVIDEHTLEVARRRQGDESSE